MAFKFKKSVIFKIVCGLIGVCFLVFAFIVNRKLDGEREWMMKIGDNKISSSEYLVLLTTKIWETIEETKSRTYKDVTLEDFKELRLSSKDVISFLQESSKETANKMLIYDKRFNEMGLSLTNEEKEKAKKIAEQMFLAGNVMYQSYAIGISKDACEAFQIHSIKAEKVKEESYKEGKPLAPKKEQLLDLAKNNMVNFIKVSVQGNIKEKKEDEREKQKEAVSGATKKVEDLLKEGKTKEDIEKEFKDKKDGIQVSVSQDFEFVENEDMDSRFSSYGKEDEEYRKIVKDMPEGETKLIEKGNINILLKKLPIEEKDIESKKEALNKKYVKSKEEEINKAELEKNKPEENESAFKKYTPEKQIDLVFANKIERPLYPGFFN